jgi:hypothetical protein
MMELNNDIYEVLISLILHTNKSNINNHSLSTHIKLSLICICSNVFMNSPWRWGGKFCTPSMMMLWGLIIRQREWGRAVAHRPLNTTSEGPDRLFVRIVTAFVPETKYT